MKGFIKAKMPGAHESHNAALIRSKNAWMDPSGASGHGAKQT